MDKKIELIERLKRLMEESGDNANSFSKKVNIDPGNLRKKLKGEYGITQKDIYKISKALGVSREWLENGTGSIYVKTAYSIGGDINIGSHVDKAFKDSMNDPDDSALTKVAKLFAPCDNQNDGEINTLSKQVEDLRKQIENEDAKSKQLIQIINAKDEALRAKDSEIRLLRKILKDNGIEV